MIANRLLEQTKSINEDSKLNDTIDLSYSIFTKEIIAQNQFNKIQKNFDIKIVSSLVRFFKLINPVIKLDEDSIKDIFKGKSLSYTNLLNKISEILNELNKRVSFSDKTNSLYVNNYFCRDNLLRQNNLLNNNIRELVGFNWKVELIISNTHSNRVLIPIIYLYFNFSNGERCKCKATLKVFQEMRKSLTYHIKKIIENERVTQLK